MAVYIHLFAALWVIVAGTSQLMTRKGTTLHRSVGWTWMAAMCVVAISSFWLTSAFRVIGPFGPIHLLSIWVLICVAASLTFIRKGNVRGHKRFAVGAFLGAVGAGIGALAAPGRLLNQWAFG